MAEWLRNYSLLLRWQYLTMRPVLPFFVIVQALMAVGVIIGFAFFFPQIDPISAMFLATGAPTLTLLTMGMVAAPQTVAQAKTQGTFDYLWSLPISRLAFMAADLTIWLLVTLPGIVLALIFGALRFDFSLQISPLVVPVILLVALTATAVGNAIGHLSPQPMLTNLISQVLVFFLLMFSPINFPVDRLPGWLASLHGVLPVKYMADLMRASLTPLRADNMMLAFGVVIVWCVVSFALTYIVVTRRR